MRLPATARWIGLAILGMLIAAVVSIAASRVASQQIGLASEPISAGDSLAPKSQEKGPGSQEKERPRVAPKSREASQGLPIQPASPPVAEPTPPTHLDDSGGSPPDDGGRAGGGADD